MGEALFQRGRFHLHSGATSAWKIECDALTDEDWRTLAMLIAERVTFSSVVGVPRGGLKLASALKAHVSSGPRLMVDDVLTTGASITEAMHEYDNGYVVFARTSDLPPRVRALFVMEDPDG